MLEEKIQTIEEKDKMVESGRTDLKSAVEKLAEMEKKARQLVSLISFFFVCWSV